MTAADRARAIVSWANGYPRGRARRSTLDGEDRVAAPFSPISAPEHGRPLGEALPPAAPEQEPAEQSPGGLSGPPPRRTALERRPVEVLAALGFLLGAVLIAVMAHCSPALHRPRLAAADPSGSRQSPSVTRDHAVLLPLLLADLDAIDLRLHRLAERGELYAQATAAASSPTGCVLGVSDYVYRPSEVLATCRTTPRISR